MSTTNTAGTATDRLTAAQRAGLDNLTASFAMEGMRPTADELKVLASYVVGDIDQDECDRRMAALAARS